MSKDKLFRTIVADPPWDDKQSRNPQNNCRPRYKGDMPKGPIDVFNLMNLNTICDLRIPSATRCHLYLWSLNRCIDYAVCVMDAWGFELVQMLTWCKPGVGMGQFQCNSEQLLICRKGPKSGNGFGRMSGTYHTWPRRRFAEKPDESFDLIRRISPGPYLEMFARRKRLGWSVWGDEVESDIIINRG